MDVSSDIYPQRNSPWLGGPHSPPDGVGHRKPHSPTNRNATSRFVTKAEQRVASGAAAKADGRVSSCQWRLVAESLSVHTGN